MNPPKILRDKIRSKIRNHQQEQSIGGYKSGMSWHVKVSIRNPEN